LLEAERGFDIFEHLIKLKKCAVVNCVGLNPILKSLVVNILSLQFNFTSICLNEISKQTKYILVVDEGDEISSRETSAKYPEGYSEYAKGFKQDRAFGGMKILGLSSYANCDPIITANTTNYFIFPPADSDSIYEASKTLLEPNSKQLIASLKCGQAIFKEVMGLVPYGMLIETDHVPPSDKVHPEKYDQHPFANARGIDDIPGFRDKVDKLIDDYKATEFCQSTTGKSNAQKSAAKLSKNERSFLDHLSLKEYEPVNIIFSHVGDISSGAQQKIIKHLKKLQFIETVQERTGKMFIRFASLTNAGKKYLNK